MVLRTNLFLYHAAYWTILALNCYEAAGIECVLIVLPTEVARLLARVDPE